MKRTFKITLTSAFLAAMLLGGCVAACTSAHAPEQHDADTAAPPSAPPPEEKKPDPMPGLGPQCPTEHCVSVMTAGDLLIHDGLWEPYATDGSNGKNFDFYPFFEGTQAYLDRADLGICDFETPVSEPGGPYEAYPLFNIPPEIADVAAQIGYDACTTSTNHSIDQGTEGLVRLLDKLDSVGIKHTGTYRTEEESQQVLIVEANGVKIGIVAAVYALNGLTPEYPWQVDSPIDTNKMIAKAQQAREQGADIVLAALHNGNEYWNEPSEEQVQQGHTLADSEAFDMVYMHHAHAIQPIEYYNGTWIAYGLGNSISESSYSYESNNQFLLLRTQFAQQEDGSWKVNDIAWAPGVNHQANVAAYKWCSVASDHPQGTCRSEAEDANVNANVKRILESMGAAEHGLHEWLITQDPPLDQ